MKKILVVVLLLVALLVGANYFTASKSEQTFKDTVTLLNSVKNLKVINDSYQRGFFDSKASFDLVYSDKSIFDDDINISFVGDIKSDIFTLLSNKTMFKFDLKSKDPHLSQLIGTLFKSDSFMSIEGKSSIFKDRYIRVNLKDLNFEDKDMIKVSGLSLELNMDKNRYVKDIVFNLNDAFAFIKTEDIKVELKSLNLKSIMKKNVAIEELLNKLTPSNSTGYLKSISVFAKHANVIIDDIKYSGLTYEKDSLLYGSDTTNISKVGMNDVVFKDIVLKTAMKNINIEAVQTMLDHVNEKYATNENIDDNVIKHNVVKMANSNPFIGLNLSLKNINDVALNSDVKLFISNASNLNTNNFNDTIVNFLNLDGYIKFMPSFDEFFAQIPQAKIFGPILLQNGIIKKDANSDIVEFKFDKQKQDIIISDSVSLKEM